MLAVYIAATALALVLLWVIYTFNLLVRAGNKVEEAFSGIDVQLRQRQDLVPNLVQVVSGYAAHERQTLAGAVEARSAAISAATPEEVAPAENYLAGRMRGLMALAEAYPALRASEQFTSLTAELTDIENEIQAARSLYNRNVEFFNTLAQQFPAYLIADRMQRSSYPFLEFELVLRDPSKLVAGGFAA